MVIVCPRNGFPSTYAIAITLKPTFQVNSQSILHKAIAMKLIHRPKKGIRVERTVRLTSTYMIVRSSATAKGDEIYMEINKQVMLMNKYLSTTCLE